MAIHYISQHQLFQNQKYDFLIDITVDGIYPRRGKKSEKPRLGTARKHSKINNTYFGRRGGIAT